MINGDARRLPFPDNTFQAIITSVPYFRMRSYLRDDDALKRHEIGLPDQSLSDYVDDIVAVATECRRVLRPDGVLWLNVDDSYNGKKGLRAIPARLQIALIDRVGLINRADVVWDKINGMCDAAIDRPSRVHEYLFLFSKSPRYFWDADAVRPPRKTKGGASWDERRAAGATAGNVGKSANYQKAVHGSMSSHALGTGDTRNLRAVWTLPVSRHVGTNSAAMSPELAAWCIALSTRPGDRVLDPFCGSGTTAWAAIAAGRVPASVDLDWQSLELTRDRTRAVARRLSDVPFVARDYGARW